MSAYNLPELARALFEGSGDALFLFDPETEALLDVNPMARRLPGYTCQELLALPVGSLFRADADDGLRRLRRACKEAGPASAREGFWLRHRTEGEWTSVNMSVTRFHAG